MSWKLSNFAKGALVQSCTDAATTIYIAAAEALLLPTLGGGDKAKGILYNASYTEIVNITAINVSGALTVERAQEATAARSWEAGTKFIHTPTAEMLQAALAALTSSRFTGAATGTNAYTVDVGASNPLPTLTDGEEVTFILPATNTSAAAPTLAVTDGTTTTTTKPIVLGDGLVPVEGELEVDWLAKVVFDSGIDAWMLTAPTSRKALLEEVNSGPVPAVSRHPNGRLDYWRRGTSFSTPASLTQTADGWYIVYDGTIGTFTISRQDFALGQTDVEGQPKHFIRWDQSSAGSTSTVRKFRVPVPGVHYRAGKQVTRSVWLKADSSRSVVARIVQHFGTGGTPSADVVADSDTLAVTTSWQRFDITTTLASIAGKTLGSNNDDAVWLELSLPINVSMTIDVACEDIRPGRVAGPQSPTFPLPWWQGGTNGSYEDQDDFISELDLMTTTGYPDLLLVEALATSGLVFRNNTGPTWGTRSIAVGTGLTVTNANGTAGNPTVSLDTALTNYNADPLSVAELASVTAVFGTAAFATIGTSGDTVPKNDTANTFSAAQKISSTLPRLQWSETDAGVDEKNYYIEVSGGSLLFRLRNDAEDTTVNAIQISRTGLTVGEIQMDATLFDMNGNMDLSGVALLADGSAAAPAYSFSGDPDTGVYSGGANILSFATAGTLRWQVTAAGILIGIATACRLQAGAGDVSFPGISFATDTDSGLYPIGANNVGLALGGTKYADFSTTLTQFIAPVQADVPVSSEVSGTLTTASANKEIRATGNITVPASVFASPNKIRIYAGASARTLTQGGGGTQRMNGTSTTGNLTIPARGYALIEFISATEWLVSGAS